MMLLEKILIFVVSVHFLACGTFAANPSDDDGETKEIEVVEGEPATFNLADFVGFGITNKENASLQGANLVDEDIETDASNLFGIKENGESQQISFADGVAIIQKIYTTPKAILFRPTTPVSLDGENLCRIVVLIKDSSEFKCIEKFSFWGDPRNRQPEVQFSDSGEFIAIEVGSERQGWGGSSEIIRLQITSLNELKISVVYDLDGYPEQWRMNATGDIAIQYATDGRKMMIRKTNGDTEELGAAEYVRCLVDGKGVRSGNFTYLDAEGENVWNSIEKKDGDPYEISELYKVTDTDDLGFLFWGCDAVLSEESRNYYAMELPDTGSSAVDDQSDFEGNVHIVELNLETPGAVKYNVPDMRRAKLLTRVEKRDDLVIFGQDVEGFGVISALNTETGESESLYASKKIKFAEIYPKGNSFEVIGVDLSSNRYTIVTFSNFDQIVEETTVDIEIDNLQQYVPIDL